VTHKLTAAAGAALVGIQARLMHQEFRRVLAPVTGNQPERSRRLGYRELLYFEVVGCLNQQGVLLTPSEKQGLFKALGRANGEPSGMWMLRNGHLIRSGVLPLSLNLATVSQQLRHRYRLLRHPKEFVNCDPAICSGQPVFRGTRILVATIVGQLKAGVSRAQLEADFPQLNATALDYAEIQAQLPRSPGRPAKALQLQR
jgi:uncharacterized protein (DUF433 family)